MRKAEKGEPDGSPFFCLRLIPLLLALLLAGCVESATVVRVQPDGSGTVEKTVLIRREALARVRSFMNGLSILLEADQESARGKATPLFDEETLKRKAAEMGPGVTYLKGERVENEGGEGFRALYRFADINTLRVDSNPLGSIAVAGVETFARSTTGCYTFRFRRDGAMATLTVEPPPGGPKSTVAEAAAPPVSDGDTEGQFLLDGLRMSLSVEPAGTVVATDASFRQGNRFMIVDLDVDRLLGGSSPQGSIGAGIPGIRAEHKPVTVQFR